MHGRQDAAKFETQGQPFAAIECGEALFDPVAFYPVHQDVGHVQNARILAMDDDLGHRNLG